MSSILAVGHEDRNIRWPHRGAANLTLRISELNVRIKTETEIQPDTRPLFYASRYVHGQQINGQTCLLLQTLNLYIVFLRNLSPALVDRRMCHRCNSTLICLPLVSIPGELWS